jgi:hypothetical protein
VKHSIDGAQGRRQTLTARVLNWSASCQALANCACALEGEGGRIEERAFEGAADWEFQDGSLGF